MGDACECLVGSGVAAAIYTWVFFDGDFAGFDDAVGGFVSYESVDGVGE